MQSKPENFLKILHITDRMKLSPDAWRAGVKSGRFPPGIQLSPRVRVWTETSIDALMQSLAAK